VKTYKAIYALAEMTDDLDTPAKTTGAAKQAREKRGGILGRETSEEGLTELSVPEKALRILDLTGQKIFSILSKLRHRKTRKGERGEHTRNSRCRRRKEVVGGGNDEGKARHGRKAGEVLTWKGVKQRERPAGAGAMPGCKVKLLGRALRKAKDGGTRKLAGDEGNSVQKRQGMTTKQERGEGICN